MKKYYYLLLYIIIIKQFNYYIIITRMQEPINTISKEKDETIEPWDYENVIYIKLCYVYNHKKHIKTIFLIIQ